MLGSPMYKQINSLRGTETGIGQNFFDDHGVAFYLYLC